MEQSPDTSILTPSDATLKKYGLSVVEWRAIAEHQGNVCSICRILPVKRRLCIDHEHVRGWKKMPPAQRKLFVRGLLCWFCNHFYVGRAITIEKARNVVAYLEKYRERSTCPTP